MTILFLSLAVIIAIIVILVSAKHVKAGFEARSAVKDQKKNQNLLHTTMRFLGKLHQRISLSYN